MKKTSLFKVGPFCVPTISTFPKGGYACQTNNAEGNHQKFFYPTAFLYLRRAKLDFLCSDRRILNPVSCLKRLGNRNRMSKDR